MTQLSDSTLQAELASAPDIVTALTDADGRLTAMEKQLRPICAGRREPCYQHFDHGNLRSVQGVSTPTVTRFYRRLGCASFSDFSCNWRARHLCRPALS